MQLQVLPALLVYCMQNKPQSTGTNVLFLTAPAGVGSFIGVKSLVQLQMDKLRELGRAQVTGVGFLARMQTQVRL